MDKLLREIGFDKAEAQFFSHRYLWLEEQDKKLLDELGMRFSSGIAREMCHSFQEKLKPLASKYNLDSRCVDMLFFLCNLEKMRQNYIKKGIGEKLFYDTAKDFKYKLDECKRTHGILGSPTFDWYYYFLNAEMVALGRFQFHNIKFFDDLSYKWNDITVNPGDTVVNIHIPASGPMPREMRMDAYKKAFEYYGKNKGEYLVMTCASWLLYPVYKEVFAKGSNMYDFIDDFDIIKETKEADETFLNSWWVFDCAYNGDTSKLPADTTLQRNFIRHLDAGKSTGWGTGIILFDGEKIVNNKRDN